MTRDARVLLRWGTFRLVGIFKQYSAPNLQDTFEYCLEIRGRAACGEPCWFPLEDPDHAFKMLARALFHNDTPVLRGPTVDSIPAMATPIPSDLLEGD